MVLAARPKRVEAKRPVRCSDCGDVRFICARNARLIQAGKAKDLCPLCRAKPVPIEATDADRQWWLDNFSPAQLHRIASGFLPFDLSTSEREREEEAA